MRLKVLFFARSREIVGASELALELGDGATTSTLLERLLREHPGLQEVMRACVFAVNQEYVSKDEAAPLKDGDEVAIIPPLSGG